MYKLLVLFLRYLNYRKCPDGHWFDVKRAFWSHEEFKFDNSDYPLCTKCGEPSV